MAKRGIHPNVISILIILYLRLKVSIQITNPFNLPVSNSSNLTRASQNRVFCPSGLPNDLNSFVSVYTGACQAAITSPTLFNKGVLDA